MCSVHVSQHVSKQDLSKHLHILSCAQASTGNFSVFNLPFGSIVDHDVGEPQGEAAQVGEDGASTGARGAGGQSGRGTLCVCGGEHRRRKPGDQHRHARGVQGGQQRRYVFILTEQLHTGDSHLKERKTRVCVLVHGCHLLSWRGYFLVRTENFFSEWCKSHCQDSFGLKICRFQTCPFL